MAKIITEKAQMQCTLGAKPTELVVTSQTFIKISGKLVATESDIQPMANIPSFGNCKCNWMQPPCIPSPQKWDSTLKDTINGKKKLSEKSSCMCALGGKISFVDTGANTFVKGE